MPARRHHYRIAFVTLAMLLLSPATGLGAVADELAARVERAAAGLTSLRIGDVIYNREQSFGPDIAGHRRLLRPLWMRMVASDLFMPPEDGSDDPSSPAPGVQKLSVDDVRPLLKHANPKVRTLAIMLLLQFDRLDVMPDIAALIDDKAETFPSPIPFSWGLDTPTAPWPMETVTVSDYARHVVDLYARSSYELAELLRSDLLKSGTSMQRVFREMCAKRDPMLNAATLRVALIRASGGISPLRPDRRPLVDAVYIRAGRLPMPRRFFVTLTLDNQQIPRDIYAPDYLLDLARQVPRDLRIAVLEDKIPLDDPDLGPGFGQSYILNNAVQLLRAEDVDLLLRLDAQHVSGMGASAARGYASAMYVVAAARLAPQRAEEILIPAIEARTANRIGLRSSGDANNVAAALVELGNDKGVHCALDWFFEQRPEPGSFGGGREGLLTKIERASPAKYRRFVALIIRDDRLFKLGPASTRLLVRAAQGYSGLSIADEGQIRDSQSVDEAQRDRHLAYLADWQRQLRDTIHTWDN